MQATAYKVRYYLRHYAVALYIIGMVMDRRKWERRARRLLTCGCLAQSGIAQNRADKIGAEIERAIRKSRR